MRAATIAISMALVFLCSNQQVYSAGSDPIGSPYSPFPKNTKALQWRYQCYAKLCHGELFGHEIPADTQTVDVFITEIDIESQKTQITYVRGIGADPTQNRFDSVTISENKSSPITPVAFYSENFLLIGIKYGDVAPDP